jgi:hypothetical protein
MSEGPTDAISTDTLTGAAEIAAFLGKTERQIVHLLWKRKIPAFKLGGRWHMRKSTYRAHIERLEAGARIAA